MTEPTGELDRILVRRLRAGDEAAFMKIVDAWGSTMLAAGSGVHAEHELWQRRSCRRRGSRSSTALTGSRAARR